MRPGVVPNNQFTAVLIFSKVIPRRVLLWQSTLLERCDIFHLFCVRINYIKKKNRSVKHYPKNEGLFFLRKNEQCWNISFQLQKQPAKENCLQNIVVIHSKLALKYVIKSTFLAFQRNLEYFMWGALLFGFFYCVVRVKFLMLPLDTRKN